MTQLHDCIQEQTLGELIEANKNFKSFMDDMRSNHLSSIYKELKSIHDKMSTNRPPWPVVWVITAQTGLCGILITYILTKGV